MAPSPLRKKSTQPLGTELELQNVDSLLFQPGDEAVGDEEDEDEELRRIEDELGLKTPEIAKDIHEDPVAKKYLNLDGYGKNKKHRKKSNRKKSNKSKKMKYTK